jgi:hypothetical protein
MSNDFRFQPKQQGVQSTNKIALIDADFIKNVVVYRIHQNYARPTYASPTPIEAIQTETQAMLDEILVGVDCKAKIFCWSGGRHKTFRNYICQEKGYKFKRKYKEPEYADMFKDMISVVEYIFAQEGIGLHNLLFPELEADDICAMLQDESTFIYSKDKDLKQIPGTHWDFPSESFSLITQEQGMRNLIKQVMIGDPTDGIPGLFRYGIKAYEKDFDTLPVHLHLEKALEIYIDKLGPRVGLDTFNEMYSLVRLLIPRGDWFKEKYAEAFTLINTLKNI